MQRRGFTNVFTSDKSFARNEDFNIACKRLRITQDVQIIYSSITYLSKLNGYSWASQSFLANEIGRSIRTVKNHIAKLKRLGLIEVERRSNGQTALYYPLPVEQLLEHILKLTEQLSIDDLEVNNVPCDGKENSREKGNSCTSPRANFSHLLYKENKTRVIPPKPPKGNTPCNGNKKNIEDANIRESFEKLWQAYPLHQAKKQAYSAFRKLLKRGILPSIEVLIKLIESLKINDRAWLKGKITFLHRWLRGERWNDESTINASHIPQRRKHTKQEQETPKVSTEDHAIMSKYMELSRCILTNRAIPQGCISEKVIKNTVGIHRLRTEGMTILPLSVFIEQYKALRT